MPLYICVAPGGSIPDTGKQKISRSITLIHCEVTNAPPTFVPDWDYPLVPFCVRSLHDRGHRLRVGHEPLAQGCFRADPGCADINYH